MLTSFFKTYYVSRLLLVVALLLGLIYFFIAEITIIKGDSMEKTLSSGAVVLVDKISYYVKSPRRGDLVKVKFSGQATGAEGVKRIIAMPGELVTIRNDQIFINNEPYNDVAVEPYTTTAAHWQLSDSEYFVLGDNLLKSEDSRLYGPVDRSSIVGKARKIIN